MRVPGLSQNAILRNHPGVAAAVEDLGDPIDPAWPIRAAQVGDAVQAALASPDVLNETVSSLAAVAVSEGCDSVAGASVVGERLAGAVAALQGIGFVGDESRRVLLIDTVLATGAALVLQAERIIQAGAHEIVPAVLLDLGATGGQSGPYRVVEVSGEAQARVAAALAAAPASR